MSPRWVLRSQASPPRIQIPVSRMNFSDFRIGLLEICIVWPSQCVSGYKSAGRTLVMRRGSHADINTRHIQWLGDQGYRPKPAPLRKKTMHARRTSAHRAWQNICTARVIEEKRVTVPPQSPSEQPHARMESHQETALHPTAGDKNRSILFLPAFPSPTHPPPLLSSRHYPSSPHFAKDCFSDHFFWYASFHFSPAIFSKNMTLQEMWYYLQICGHGRLYQQRDVESDKSRLWSWVRFIHWG